jgi:hypothetical protein
VLDGSDRGQGASQRWVSLLSGMGFAARDGGTAKVATRTRVIDNSGGQDAKTAQWLASYFGVIPESGSPASPSAAADDAPAASGVTLILGQDEERLFLNDWETTMSPAAIPTLDTSTRPRATANSRRSTSSLSSSPPPGVTPMPFQPSQAASGSGLLPGLIGHGTQR